MGLSPEEAARLVAQAAAGDRGSWEQLVDAYSGMIWAIARDHRLSDSDASDVSQTTWLRLLEYIDRINDASRVGAWLATTARRECLRQLARSKRTVLVPDDQNLEPPMREQPAAVDEALLRAERDCAARAALAELPARCQSLLRLLVLDPPLSYEEISTTLGVPIGSIGPTRGRCLQRLRALLGEL